VELEENHTHFILTNKIGQQLVRHIPEELDGGSRQILISNPLISIFLFVVVVVVVVVVVADQVTHFFWK